MRNWSSNAWVLAILSVVLMIVTVDYARQMLKKGPSASEGKTETAKPNPENRPEFQVGAVAPDFTLMDARMKPQTLSKLVKKDTVLSFLCGCSNCRQYQTYLAALSKQLKDTAPEFISVTSSAPEAESSYKRDVPLKQTILYEKQGGQVMEQYKGHPCPRAYRLNADRTVKFIGTSMSVTPLAQEVAYEVAREYRFATAGMKNDALPMAPNWNLVTSAPPAPVKQAKVPDEDKIQKSPTGGSLPPYLQQPTVGN